MAATRVAIAPMKAAQIPNPGGDFQIVDLDVPKPGAGQVRIIQYPRVQDTESWASSFFGGTGWCHKTGKFDTSKGREHRIPSHRLIPKYRQYLCPIALLAAGS